MMGKEDMAFADKYMAITRRGGKITDIKANRKAYDKKMKLHGFLVLVANKERDANRCLEKYRSREYIEEDVKNHKEHTGGKHPRVWHDDTLDGQLLIQFLALSMHESFDSMLRFQKDTLAIPNGDIEHDKAENLKAEKRLKDWLRKISMHDILQWFDIVEQTNVTSGSIKKCWITEKSNRDQMLLDKLGITPML